MIAFTLFGLLPEPLVATDKYSLAELLFNSMTPVTTPLGLVLVIIGAVMSYFHMRKFRWAMDHAQRLRGFRDYNPSNAVIEERTTRAFGVVGGFSAQFILPWGFVVFMLGKLTLVSPMAMALYIIWYYP